MARKTLTHLVKKPTAIVTVSKAVRCPFCHKRTLKSPCENCNTHFLKAQTKGTMRARTKGKTSSGFKYRVTRDGIDKGTMPVKKPTLFERIDAKIKDALKAQEM